MVRAKKSLGQHFLLNGRLLQKIVRACNLQCGDHVLEIGPGTGSLTRLIAPQVASLTCLELDGGLCKALQESFAGIPHVSIVQCDVLKFDLPAFMRGKEYTLKVVGNIPYYITSPILEFLIQYRRLVTEAYLTIQKEVAQRLVAVPGTKQYGALSCFVQYYMAPRMLFHISAGSFSPAPKVASSVVRLAVRSTPPVDVEDERLFFSLIRQAFMHRRKTLANSLQGMLDAAVLDKFFAAQKLDSRIRAEQLTLAAFAALCREARKPTVSGSAGS